MRRCLVALLVLAVWPSAATAAPVLVRATNGKVRDVNDPYVHGPAITPAPAGSAPAGSVPPASASARPGPSMTPALAHARRKAQITVPTVLARLYRSHAITAWAYHRYQHSFSLALRAERRLHGARRTELGAVTTNLHQMALAGSLTASRLPVLFLTLDRNRQWWNTGPLLSYGQRVEFQGSQLVWEFYPGQGIQLQVLGSFGRANGLYSAGKLHYPALTSLLGELIPLAARRAGGLAWEYYFHFDGGRPPWTSGMSQATGLEALSRAYRATKNQYYLQVGQSAMPVFRRRPPSGVAVPAPSGTRFLQYTFAPRASIINAFLQTLIGLQSYAQVSHNPQAASLFASGNREAQAEVPRFDTGAWSLYQPGIEDSLDYHELVTGFLAQLCSSTKAPVYCTTAQHFQAYLTTPPQLRQLTFAARPRRTISLRFRLSKISHVGIVLTRGRAAVYATSASFGYGTHRVTLPAQRAGAYGVRLAATDLAGNFRRITGSLNVR